MTSTLGRSQPKRLRTKRLFWRLGYSNEKETANERTHPSNFRRAEQVIQLCTCRAFERWTARASEVRSIGSGLRLAREAGGRASCNRRRETYRFRVPAIKILHGLGSAEKKKPTSAGLVTGAACDHGSRPDLCSAATSFLRGKKKRKKWRKKKRRERKEKRSTDDRRYVSTNEWAPSQLAMGLEREKNAREQAGTRAPGRMLIDTNSGGIVPRGRCVPPSSGSPGL